jgi:hypothetical protein
MYSENVRWIFYSAYKFVFFLLTVLLHKVKFIINKIKVLKVTVFRIFFIPNVNPLNHVCLSSTDNS